jgi:hypothetical protein
MSGRFPIHVREHTRGEGFLFDHPHGYLFKKNIDDIGGYVILSDSDFMMRQMGWCFELNNKGGYSID